MVEPDEASSDGAIYSLRSQLSAVAKLPAPARPPAPWALSADAEAHHPSGFVSYPRPPQLSLSRWNRRRRILLAQPAAGSSASPPLKIHPIQRFKWLGLRGTRVIPSQPGATSPCQRGSASKPIAPSILPNRQASECLLLPVPSRILSIRITVLWPPFCFIVDSLSAPRLCATPAALGLV
jgi:hypothetical protein